MTHNWCIYGGKKRRRRFSNAAFSINTERAKVRKAMETTLLTTVMKIITSVNSFKDHIPPITTTETNPFPYNITVNQKDAVGGGWGGRFGGLY